MDVNGVRFHLLLGFDEWAVCSDGTRPIAVRPENGVLALRDTGDLDWDSNRHELTLKRELSLLPPPSVAAAPLGPANRRGAGRDRFGNWYWIDDTGRSIRVNSDDASGSAPFWPTADATAPPTPGHRTFQPVAAETPRAPLAFSGLAVTDDHYLIVGVLDPPGLLVFDLYSGGPPVEMSWPSSVPFAPFDMAPIPGGGLWILDRDNRRYWGLDRGLRPRNDTPDVNLPIAGDFQPTDPAAAPAKPITFPNGVALNFPATSDPLAIEALPDCSVLILEQPANGAFPIVHRFKNGKEPGASASSQGIIDVIEGKPAGFRFTAQDFAFVPNTDPNAIATDPIGHLYFVSTAGNQSFKFAVFLKGTVLTLTADPAYLPMQFYAGRGLVAAAGTPYYDFTDQWVPLVEQPRPRFAGSAVIETPASVEPFSNDLARGPLDGRDPGCIWHRLMLDASIPPGTSVRVHTRAADDPGSLHLAPWQPEPTPYRRGDGSELPFDHSTSSGRYGTYELLFQQARGRFLQIKLELKGDGRSSPKLRALRAYYPRFSYLERYLPALYREDAESASFLDRFLANVEGLFTAIEDKIAAVQILLDVRSAAPDALEWLIGWFGVAADPSWDDSRRRLFLRNAMRFFAYRGTARGLQMALHLAMDRCVDDSVFADPAAAPIQATSVRIMETFRTRKTPAVLLGDPTDLNVSRPVSSGTHWQPTDGGTVVNAAYNSALNASSAPGQPVLRTMFRGSLPLTQPSGAIASTAWTHVVTQFFGFIPAAKAADLGSWQDFLARRYRSISALSVAYQRPADQGSTGFDTVPYPLVLPADGAPLNDWFQFESLVLPIRRAAHRFTVLLPTTTLMSIAEMQGRIDLAKRVVGLEKPAHTVFDVRFYWAMFRVDAVRLGIDTLLDVGSRSVNLYRSMVLGESEVAAAFLHARLPQDAFNRTIVGRDPLPTRYGPFAERHDP